MVAGLQDLGLDLFAILEELRVRRALQGDDARILRFNHDELVVHLAEHARHALELFLVLLLLALGLFIAPRKRKPASAAGIAPGWITAAGRISPWRILCRDGQFHRQEQRYCTEC